MSILHNIMDKNGNLVWVRLTARIAIRHNCRMCMGYNSHEVKYCTSKNCPLFPFRNAGRPSLRGSENT